VTYRILAIDGGGVKGIFSAQILNRLFKSHPELINNIDLITGTSTGAIIAASLAAGYTPEQTVAFYKNNLPKVFKDSYWDDVKDLGKLIGADYDYANLKKVLKNNFSDATLGSLKKKILIPSLDLDCGEGASRSWKPKFFNNFQDSDLNELIVDVLIRSAAAPTYFPTYQGYADGGLVTNNPSVPAISQALDVDTGKQSLSDIVLLSIGPGFHGTFISGNKLDWGVSQWATLLTPIFVDSMKFESEYICKRLLNDRYKRIDPYVPEKIALDDVSKLDRLVELADDIDLTDSLKWLNNHWKN